MQTIEATERARTEAFVAQLQQQRSVLVVAHSNPDGDAISSILAVGQICRRLGLTVTMVATDPIPRNLRWLPGVEHIENTYSNEKFDAVVVVDCGHADRVGPAFVDAKYERVFVLDHHIIERPYGDVALVDTTAAATAEMAYRVAMVAGVTLDPNLATILFTGLSTDTGGFRFGNTTARVLAIASELAASGAEPAEIARNLYDQNPRNRVEAMAEVLTTLSFDHGGKTGSIVLSQQLLVDHSIEMSQLDGLVDIPRGVEGVVVAVQYKEQAEGGFKVSLRSHGAVNVQQVATQFGGGGHLNASGCRLDGTLDEVKQRINAALEQLYLDLS